jgi:two-component system response regulator (stage 0 sporulation protein F)
MGNNQMILVVDDDPLVRATIVRALTELGYQTGEAVDGEAAIAALRTAELPSLVVLDYIMPGMDGAETAREIAAIDPDLPVIFSTGHSALRALRAAAGDDVDVLAKPFTLDELDELLRERLAERRRARSA